MVPPEITTDARSRAALATLLKGMADNSRRALSRDARTWTAWCHTKGIDPARPDAGALTDFARDHRSGAATGRPAGPNTVARAVATIGRLSRDVLALGDPSADPAVRAEIREMRRLHGRPPRQAEGLRSRGDVSDVADDALPLSVDAMIAALANACTVAAARDALILSIGIDTGRRRAEYAALDVGDVARAADGSGTLAIRRSKTDQEGRGRIKYLSRRTMRLLDAWMEARRSTGQEVDADSPLLLRLNRHGGLGERITPAGFAHVVRRIAREHVATLGRDAFPSDIDDRISRIGGHSFRVGIAQDLVAAGEDVLGVCEIGDWSSPAMPLAYARHLAPRSGAVARLRRRQGQA